MTSATSGRLRASNWMLPDVSRRGRAVRALPHRSVVRDRDRVTTFETAAAIEVSDLVKGYQGLRPLRLKHLHVREGERVAISGLDTTAAEVLTNLLNGGILADTGEVRVFGRLTADIQSEEEWLAFLERFGIVSPRAVLLEAMTIEQNLALPFTLEVDEIAGDVRARIHRLADEVGLPAAALAGSAGQAAPDVRMRAHLARALALEPTLLLMEHPTVSMPRDAVPRFATTVRAVAERRRLTLVAITGDVEFADRVADRAYRLQGGTGVLTNARGWRRWL